MNDEFKTKNKIEDDFLGNSESKNKKIKKEIFNEHDFVKKKFFLLFLLLLIAPSIILGSILGSFLGQEKNNELLMKIEELNNRYDSENSLVEKESGESISSGLNNENYKNLLQEDRVVVSVVDKVSPSVVSIIVTKDVPKLDDAYVDPFFSDPFFAPFFGRDFQQKSSGEIEKKEIGGGTGFIVDESGYIITNRHVVDDEDAEYTVVMNDGEKIQANVLARDSFMDLAVLKVDKDGLPFVSLGDSDKLKTGQTVIAIGNSLGEFRNTVSKGIISGLMRSLNAGDGLGETEFLDEVIQTDAAINPGNSGGPIIDLKGDVVGVNVAMAQGAENIGFSIPINEVVRIYDSVKETGKIVRPYLGVRYVLVNEEVKEANNLSFDYGAVVVKGKKNTDLAVVPSSPADKAGLKENDIILELDGLKIDKDHDLASIVKRRLVGDEIVLKVYSKGEEKEVSVVLEEAQ